MFIRNMSDLLWLVVVALTFCFAIYILADTTKETNKRYYDTVNKCIEHGGSWIRQTDNCVRNK